MNGLINYIAIYVVLVDINRVPQRHVLTIPISHQLVECSSCWMESVELDLCMNYQLIDIRNVSY